MIALAADGYAMEISRDELQETIIALKDADGWIVNMDKDLAPSAWSARVRRATVGCSS